MPDRNISEQTGQIVDDTDLIAKPVRDALNAIVAWFATTVDVGISNSDIASNAAIVTTKLKHSNTALDVFLGLEHSLTGVHTQRGNGLTNLVIQEGDPRESHILITADYITTYRTDGDQNLAGLKIDGTTETTSEEIILDDTDDSMDATDGSAIVSATSSTLTILCLRDLTTGGVYTTKFVYYEGISLDTTFYSTDLTGYNTRMSKNYTHARIVGAVYVDADDELEQPRPIGGGSTNDSWIPSPMLMATGSFTGTGSANSITGVGFRPTLLITNNGTTAGTTTRFKTVEQAGAISAYFGNGSATETGITSLDTDGFTVATDAGDNESGVLIQWIAFKGNR